MIVQDDTFTRSRIGTVVVVPLTTNSALGGAPGNVYVVKEDSGLSKDSVIVVSQLYAIDKRRLIECAVKIRKSILDTVVQGIEMVLGINT